MHAKLAGNTWNRRVRLAVLADLRKQSSPCQLSSMVSNEFFELKVLTVGPTEPWINAYQNLHISHRDRSSTTTQLVAPLHARIQKERASEYKYILNSSDGPFVTIPATDYFLNPWTTGRSTFSSYASNLRSCGRYD